MNGTAISRGVVRALFLTVMFTCTWASADAGLLTGSSVTGELYFGSDLSTNWFDGSPIPCGLNDAGATVTVSGTATEFCSLGLEFLSVDFNDTNPQLTVVFNTRPEGTVPAITIYLTDTAFEGLT